jgi:hypothetical protein
LSWQAQRLEFEVAIAMLPAMDDVQVGKLDGVLDNRFTVYTPLLARGVDVDVGFEPLLQPATPKATRPVTAASVPIKCQFIPVVFMGYHSKQVARWGARNAPRGCVRLANVTVLG